MTKHLFFALAALFVFTGSASSEEIVNIIDQSNISAVASGGSNAVAGGIYAQDATHLINVVSQSNVSAIATNGALAVAGGIDAIGDGCKTCGSITNVVNKSNISAIADGDSTAVAGSVILR